MPTIKSFTIQISLLHGLTPTSTMSQTPIRGTFNDKKGVLHFLSSYARVIRSMADNARGYIDLLTADPVFAAKANVAKYIAILRDQIEEIDTQAMKCDVWSSHVENETAEGTKFVRLFSYCYMNELMPDLTTLQVTTIHEQVENTSLPVGLRTQLFDLFLKTVAEDNKKSTQQ